MRFLSIFLSLIFFGYCGISQAQIVPVRVVVAAAGSDTLIGKTTWASTVGEAVVLTLATGSNVFTQGFNQPDGYQVNAGIPFIRDLVIYPNPAHSMATIRFYLNEDKLQLNIEIYDAQGKLYQNQQLKPYAGQTWHSLNPQVMAAGTYMVRVTAGYEIYVGKVVIVN